MPKRDPHDVLGVRPGATAATIKAAWRRLARSHHPDLTGDDPAASRVATRKMAEINDAYETLRRADIARRGGPADGPPAPGPVAGGPRRSGGPPRPRPTKPVTGRLDTSGTFRPRNATTSARASLRGQPPLRVDRLEREPLRASDPNGPLERARLKSFRRPPPPTIDAAIGVELEFGKFRGHTLGEVAAFEPSYIDWLATTITRDPDLVAAARVVADDLNRRGVARRLHPDRPTRRAATGGGAI